MDCTRITVTLDNHSFNIASSTSSEAELRAVEAQVNSLISSISQANPNSSAQECSLYALFCQTAELAQKTKEYKNLEAVVNELKDNRRRDETARATSAATHMADTPAKRPFETATIKKDG